MEVGTDGLIIFNSNGRKIKFIETDTFNTFHKTTNQYWWHSTDKNKKPT
ncbi:hypothetical protein [Bacillus mycoides]|nr:hypothetical protein [Bacillus mycoides]